VFDCLCLTTPFYPSFIFKKGIFIMLQNKHIQVQRKHDLNDTEGR
jgi:hypothetical protein